jgi:NMT1/THI5 like
MSIGDINSLMRFLDNPANPQVKAVMIVYDSPPFAIVTLKKNNIRTPKDLEGKILGAPVLVDEEHRLFERGQRSDEDSHAWPRSRWSSTRRAAIWGNGKLRKRRDAYDITSVTMSIHRAISFRRPNLVSAATRARPFVTNESRAHGNVARRD